ncbi:MAG: hypothetical protein IJC88_04860 [Oscillospiraceae bacterium]|nr:hypothetical protein [Oscillospiraceae bacterium]
MKRLLACVLLLVFLVSGCASVESKLVGKWEREGDKLILNEDYTGDLSGTSITWMYTNEELQMIYDDGMNVAFDVEFEGRDRLILTSAGEYGMTAEFSRVED